ncbi:hypothetical protein, partial [Absiella sp. AM54-8XD]|uniref:hypothetical protein n=1 Tax=Absiella sp. AM54-8XD TaxID=2292279 RepID=UPI001F3F02B3
SYGLKVTSVNEYDLYMQGKWNKLDEVLNSNVKLIEWLEEFIDINLTIVCISFKTNIRCGF